MEDDILRSRRDVEDDRAQRRAELFLPVSNQVANLSFKHPPAVAGDGEEDELKVVDEIESMCMNCEQDVSPCPAQYECRVSCANHLK